MRTWSGLSRHRRTKHNEYEQGAQEVNAHHHPPHACLKKDPRTAMVILIPENKGVLRYRCGSCYID